MELTFENKEDSLTNDKLKLSNSDKIKNAVTIKETRMIKVIQPYLGSQPKIKNMKKHVQKEEIKMTRIKKVDSDARLATFDTEAN